MTKKWYHYGMLPVGGQIVIAGLAMVVFVIQMAIYEDLEEKEVTYNNECVAGIIATDEGGFNKLLATCPEIDELLPLTYSVTKDYLFALSKGETLPVYCTQTETTYLHDISWACKLNNE